MNSKKYILQIIFLVLFINKGYTQTIGGVQTDGSRQSDIITAVPFLLIVPQARAGAMGNAGVAVDADANASTMNSSAMAFLPEKTYGVSVSYSPWLRSLVSDMNLSYVSVYYRLNERSTLGASLRYFSIGKVLLRDNNFQELGISNPNEYAADISYVRKFGPEFALGGTVRYIYSNLSSNQALSSGRSEPGRAIAVDVSGLYKKEALLFGEPMIWSAGINLSNIGTKMSYGSGNTSYFLPANFKIGTAATLLGQDSRLIIALDLNKLMAPTQPIYDVNGQIVKGKDPDRSVPAGIFGSFSDAPGGLSEELREINISTGLEYSFKDAFAFRAGYNYQDPKKGNARYFTFGAGFKYNVMSIDVAYLAGTVRDNPLANTLRFTLQAKFGSGGKR